MDGVFAGEWVGARFRSLSARATLALLVSGSAAVRFLFALRRPTITYLPDEYTYAELARGIAETGRPVVRGAAAHFPALLEPLLAAPLWLQGSPGLAFRLTQAESALLMSCGAIPVYLVARRLGVGTGWALGCAVVALVSPDLLYASYLTADGVAYPIVLTAIYAGVVALESRRRRAQVAFVALAALAGFARIQYLLLLPVFLVAALVVEPRSPRRALGSAGIALGTTVAAAGVGLALGPGRLVGTYDDALHPHLSLAGILHQTATDATLLPFSAGIVLVPGALVALGRGLSRSAPAAERAFAALTILFGIGVFAEAVLGGAAGSGNYIERYLICFLPLLAPAFCVYVRRGGGRIAVAVLATALALIAIRVPLSGDAAADRWTDSTTLYAVARLEQLAGIGVGALIVSLIALVLALVAVVVASRPARGGGIALALTAATFAAASVAATSWDIEGSRSARDASFATAAGWVDAARLGTVTLLDTPGANPGDALEQLFWNTSLDRVVLLPGASPFDKFAAPAASITPAGAIVADGAALDGPVLIDGFRTWLTLGGVRLVAAADGYRLYRPSGQPHLTMEATGSLASGWLASSGSITVWPQATPSRLTLALALPRGAPANTVVFTVGSARRSIRIGPGQTATASFLLAAHVASTVSYASAHVLGYSEGTAVGVEAGRPELTPLPAAAGASTRR